MKKIKEFIKQIPIKTLGVLLGVGCLLVLPFILDNYPKTTNAQYLIDNESMDNYYYKDTITWDTLSINNKDYNSTSVYDIQNNILGGDELTADSLSQEVKNYTYYDSPFINKYDDLVSYRIGYNTSIYEHNSYYDSSLTFPIKSIFDSEGLNPLNDIDDFGWLDLYFYCDEFLLYNAVIDEYVIECFSYNDILFDYEISFWVWSIDTTGLVYTTPYHYSVEDVSFTAMFQDFETDVSSVYWTYITDLTIKVNFKDTGLLYNNVYNDSYFRINTVSRYYGDEELGTPFIFWLNYQIGNYTPPLDINFVEWISNAVNGFLDIELIPGFPLIAIITTLLAVSIVIAFLKIFAGG